MAKRNSKKPHKPSKRPTAKVTSQSVATKNSDSNQTKRPKVTASSNKKASHGIAKISSKKSQSSKKPQSDSKKPSLRSRIHDWRAKRVRLHRSFKRSYREDYLRKTKTPGLLTHAMTTFQFIFRHWRTFLPLVVLMTILYIVLVGLMTEDFYLQFQENIDATSAEMSMGKIGNFAKAGLLLIASVTTGGLDAGMDEVGTVFMIMLLLMIWLVTLFLMRHFYARSQPKLRDALYNSMGPLISTLLIFMLMIVQALPIMIVIITYSAATATGFLSTPFYALVYFIFALLMILLSAYMLAGSTMALIIVTVPGTYPLDALATASDLIAGRRTRFIIRIAYLIFVIAIVYIIAVFPVILLDLWLKSLWTWLAGWPIVPFVLLFVTCFVCIYITAYVYRYYRYLIDDQAEKPDPVL